MSGKKPLSLFHRYGRVLLLLEGCISPNRHFTYPAEVHCNFEDILDSKETVLKEAIAEQGS